MTTVTVLYKGERIVGFTAKGHAGYAAQGEDIVCSAVSALTQTAYLGISEFVEADVSVDQSDGRLRLELPSSLSDEERGKAELILGTMLLGLRAVEENYSDYLKIVKREVKA